SSTATGPSTSPAIRKGGSWRCWREENIRSQNHQLRAMIQAAGVGKGGRGSTSRSPGLDRFPCVLRECRGVSRDRRLLLELREILAGLETGSAKHRAQAGWESLSSIGL